MAKIVKSFVQALPRLQARKIEQQLQSPQEQAKFATIQEFRAEFQKRLRDLLESQTLIRFSPYELVSNRKRLSETMDEMIKLLSSDLSSMFSETDLLIRLKDLQKRLYDEEILERLRKAVREAETEVERLEVLKGNTSGLKDAVLEKFESGANRLPRRDIFASEAYIDPKLDSPAIPELDMPVGLNVGGLVLPTDIEESLRLSNIQDVSRGDSRTDSDMFGLPGSD